MHFWELAARRNAAKSEPGSAMPNKMGLYWFMPAFANKSVGSLWGTTEEDGTCVWPCCCVKKSKKMDLTLLAGHVVVDMVLYTTLWTVLSSIEEKDEVFSAACILCYTPVHQTSCLARCSANGAALHLRDF